MNTRLQPLHFILLLGLALRLWVLIDLSANNPIFDLPIVDAKEYVDDGTYYNEVSWLGTGGSYFHPPGYSYFIGIIFLFFGKSLMAIRLVQIGMDAVNIYLLFLIAHRIFDGRVALVSAFLYAIYARSLQYSVEILPPVLVMFLLLMSIYFLLRSSSGSSEEEKTELPLWPLSVSALFLGLLIVTLPNFLLAIPVFLLWILFSPVILKKKKALLLSLFLFICLSPVFLTALRNRLVANEGLLISRNGGINFFIGNNPDIKKTVGATPGIEWDKLLMLPYQTERTTNFQEQDDFFSRKTMDYVLSDPSGWIKLMWKKTLWYFNAYEFPRNFDVYFFAQYAFLTKYPVFGLSLLFPLALAGMFLSLGFNGQAIRFKKLVLPDINVLLLLGIFLIYSFSIVLVFVAARYRLPVVPLMILFASYFLVLVYERALKKNIQGLMMLLLLVGVFAFITQQRFFFNEYPCQVSPVFTNTLLANTLINAGQREEGRKFLDEALRLPEDESTDDAYFELGHYYRGVNEKEKAKECFYRSVKLDPHHFKSWNSLGFEHKMEGDFSAAIRCLQKGIAVAPCFPELYLNLADCYLLRKKTDSAVVVLESYYQNCPSPHPNISESLGKIYMDVYLNFEKAAFYYRETIDYPQGFDPGAEMYNRLGACYYKLKSYKKAKQSWVNGLRINPAHKAIIQNIDLAKKEVPGWNDI